MAKKAARTGKKKTARKAAKAKKASRPAKKPVKKAARKSAGIAKRKPAKKKPAKKKTARKVAKKGPARKTLRRKAAAKPARKAATKSVRMKKAAPPKPRSLAPASAQPLGEGDWKSDQKYSAGLQSWGASHDSAALAHEAEAELPGDLRESSDHDVADAASRGSGSDRSDEPDEEW